MTIDAMGFQRAIAKKIRNRRADDILALKGNQGALRDTPGDTIPLLPGPNHLGCPRQVELRRV